MTYSFSISYSNFNLNMCRDVMLCSHWVGIASKPICPLVNTTQTCTWYVRISIPPFHWTFSTVHTTTRRPHYCFIFQTNKRHLEKYWMDHDSHKRRHVWGYMNVLTKFNSSLFAISTHNVPFQPPKRRTCPTSDLFIYLLVAVSAKSTS